MGICHVRDAARPAHAAPPSSLDSCNATAAAKETHCERVAAPGAPHDRAARRHLEAQDPKPYLTKKPKIHCERVAAPGLPRGGA